jgi:pilus assembly protein CpaE
VASNLQTTGHERTRVFLTGAGAGFEQLHAALAPRAELELLGGGEREPAPGELNGNVDVVLHAPRGERPLADELAAVREHTSAPIILVASSNIEVLLEQALTADLADVLVLPQPIEAVLFAIRRIGRSSSDDGSGAAARVVTVFSPKGGAGKTVVASSLAAFWARQGERTLLIDLDLRFGDAALMLGLMPEKTVHDLVSAPGALDADKLAGYTTEHVTGLSLLAAPSRPEQGEHVDAAGVARLIEVAREAYDAVVIDTAPAFDNAMLAALDLSDELLVLTGPDVPSLKNVRLGLGTLDLLSFPRERVSLVDNRSGAWGGIATKDVERALDHSVRFTLPNDKTVPLGVNRGHPAVLWAEAAPFSRAVAEMASALLPRPAAEPVRRRYWRWG